jgi:hypothetical protein
MIRNDLDRLLEAQFLLESTHLRKSKSLQEYFNSSYSDIYEFLNPSKSYTYDKVSIDGGYMFKVSRVENDPQFLISLKKNGKSHVLDFYWPESEKGFEKIEGLRGGNYLDTLAKIIQDEIIPMLENGILYQILFTPYSVDSAGDLREKIFDKITKKFVDTDKFTIFKKLGVTSISRK